MHPSPSSGLRRRGTFRMTIDGVHRRIWHSDRSLLATPSHIGSSAPTIKTIAHKASSGNILPVGRGAEMLNALADLKYAIDVNANISAHNSREVSISYQRHVPLT